MASLVFSVEGSIHRVQAIKRWRHWRTRAHHPVEKIDLRNVVGEAGHTRSMQEHYWSRPAVLLSNSLWTDLNSEYAVPESNWQGVIWDE